MSLATKSWLYNSAIGCPEVDEAEVSAWRIRRRNDSHISHGKLCVIHIQFGRQGTWRGKEFKISIDFKNNQVLTIYKVIVSCFFLGWLYYSLVLCFASPSLWPKWLIYAMWSYFTTYFFGEVAKTDCYSDPAILLQTRFYIWWHLNFPFHQEYLSCLTLFYDSIS